MNIEFSHKTKLRVRYGETDQMGYCYYGNYAQYFEVGRVEALRALGMSYKSLEDNGVMLPVSEFTVNYKAPAIYDDELTITTVIKEARGPKLFFEYTIHVADKLIAIATTTLVFVSKSTMKPIQPPREFIAVIERFTK